VLYITNSNSKYKQINMRKKRKQSAYSL